MSEIKVGDRVGIVSQSLVRIEYTTTRTVWQFPKDRFVEYGPEDEWWARKYGFGEERQVSTTLVIPRALITGVSERGVEFRAIPEYGASDLEPIPDPAPGVVT